MTEEMKSSVRDSLRKFDLKIVGHGGSRKRSAQTKHFRRARALKVKRVRYQGNGIWQ